MPESWASGKYVAEGVEKFGRYFRRKGWFGFDREHEVSGEEVERVERGEGGGQGVRILVEVATAYAVTKVLLPVRIILSVWATPWFARVAMGRFWRGKGVGKGADAAGTGATGGGVIGRGKS